MKVPKKTLWLAVVFLGLGIVISVMMFTRQSPLPSAVTILPPGYNIPPQKASIPDRWISRKWGWYWRLKQRVFGPPKIVSLAALVFEFNGSPEELLSNLGAGEATFTNNS